MSPYWIYYAATFLFAFAQQNPWFALVAVGFFVLRPWLPDPVALFRNLSRIGRLREQAGMNSANVTARRDLGIAYLDLKMPRTALRYLDEARALDPKSQEIAYLRGLALLRRGAYDDAVTAFGLAVGIDPERGEPFSSTREDERAFRRYGEAFLGAAKALERLDRLAQAEQALEMSTGYNTSILEPWVRLARVRDRQGNSVGAKDARAEARRTFRHLPGFMKRRQIGDYVRVIVGV